MKPWARLTAAALVLTLTGAAAAGCSSRARTGTRPSAEASARPSAPPPAASSVLRTTGVFAARQPQSGAQLRAVAALMGRRAQALGLTGIQVQVGAGTVTVSVRGDA